MEYLKANSTKLAHYRLKIRNVIDFFVTFSTHLCNIPFNQEILTKLVKVMHQLSINLLCSSDNQTAYNFCEIKNFVKQANSLCIHFKRSYSIDNTKL